MENRDKQGLTRVLDALAELTDNDEVLIGQIVEKLGTSSFASVMLIFTLISASPASAIPGVTAVVGMIVAILVVQIILGKRTVWLPDALLRRGLSGHKLKAGIDWLRKPVGWVERILRPRFSVLLHRLFLLLPLSLTLCLALFMPVMEVVPTSGFIASAVIALFAGALLTRDGLLVIFSPALMSAIPIAVWQFWPSV